MYTYYDLFVFIIHDCVFECKRSIHNSSCAHDTCNLICNISLDMLDNGMY